MTVSERRKYIRLEIPVEVAYVPAGEKLLRKTDTKNISAEGIRVTSPESMDVGAALEIKLSFENLPNPVHLRGKVKWVKKLSSEDEAPFDIGIEFTGIEEDNKNTFLKLLCDLLYAQAEKMSKG
jgi:c-di-GMP-binding flagellar brake protein YcgR